MGQGERLDILAAAQVGDLRNVIKLLDSDPSLIGVRADGSEETLLHLAASFGHAELVRLLIERGADVNAEAYYHYTPLSSALRSEPAECAKIVQFITAVGGVEYL